ncbi:MAG: glycosyltransferase family 4 protein [Bacteroidales bacterium]|nr:glycosyltransferase family 4 protein [Bacteroidales bacterium]
MERKKTGPLKIAMIGHKRVPGGEGGVEVVVEELAVRMAAQGHQVTLYNRAGGQGPRLREYKGCRIITVPTLNKKSLDALIYSFLAVVRSLFGGYDLWHFHALGPSVMLLLPHLLGKRTVATVHGLDWQRAKWGGLGTRYLQLGERVIARYADEVIVLSRGVQEYFWETYGRKTTLIPNGVNLPQPLPPRLIREEYGLEKGRYILFLARIVPEKGLHYLLDAFEKLDTDCKLVIAGGDSHSGGYCEQVLARAARDERVVLTGFVQGEKKQELFSNCGLYVLPSDIEGMPISLLEAMSYGAPCLVSDIEENTQVLGSYGARFRKGDPEDLRRALAQALTQPPPAGREQQEYIQREYSWDRVVEETLALYRGNKQE